MKIRLKFISVIVAFLLGILAFVPAFAGGWATITLDELPEEITEREPVEDYRTRTCGNWLHRASTWGQAYG